MGHCRFHSDRPFDQPREADHSVDEVHNSGWLWTLAGHLDGQGLRVKTTGDVLVVCDQNYPGAFVLVSCRRRADDGDSLWFFASYEPLVKAESEHLADAVAEICSLLASGHRSAL